MVTTASPGAETQTGGSDSDNEFGDFIKVRRNGKGLNQEQLAEMAGVTGPFICSIEKGKRLPSEDKCVGLAKALDVPLKEMVERLRREKSPEEVAEVFSESHRFSDPQDKEVNEFLDAYLKLNDDARACIKTLVQMMTRYLSS